jgi:iron(II)-dependent oxidoreductase
MVASTQKIIGIALAIALGAWSAACDECETSQDCGAGEACIDGACQASEPFNPASDSDTDADSDTGSDSDTEDPYALDWVEIEGGTFPMGYALGQEDEQPVHDVTVPTFEITRTEITAIQYSPCVSAGDCEEPTTGSRYNWMVSGRANHPINGVDWENADAFCAFVGGRLPSEAEWEYAARSEGQDLVYPWGDDEPTCDFCIMNDDELGLGCDENRTWAVCSKQDGNTEQGLCDMSGNVYEWMADYYYYDYNGAPTDGSAWDVPPYEEYADRTIRSGSFQAGPEITALRTSGRTLSVETEQFTDLGFRCARDVD